MAILRWGIGFLCVLPAALLMKARWPQRRISRRRRLGFCFFGVFFVLYNIAMSYTTAARAEFALATLPLHDHGGRRAARHGTADVSQTIGVCVAVLGVAAALAAGLSAAPAGAWRGELIMTGGRVLHGLLQRLVPAVHPALERTGFPHRRHGNGCRRTDPGRPRTAAWPH